MQKDLSNNIIEPMQEELSKPKKLNLQIHRLLTFNLVRP
jgi:hypothetical protein